MYRTRTVFRDNTDRMHSIRHFRCLLLDGWSAHKSTSQHNIHLEGDVKRNAQRESVNDDLHQLEVTSARFCRTKRIVHASFEWLCLHLEWQRLQWWNVFCLWIRHIDTNWLRINNKCNTKLSYRRQTALQPV